jgi:iron complex transport system ATP-binding protein
VDLTGSDLTAAAGGHLIVDGVTFEVPSGSLTGVLGPNGAGKTTLLRLVAGALHHDRGVVWLDGDDASSLTRTERARMMAVLEQEARTDVPVTVLDVVLLGRIPHRRGWFGAPDEHDLEVARSALHAVDAGQLGERTWQTLSGGERQRVQIARALAQEPQLLVLDEPTNHLDIAAQLAILELVRAAGVTALAALHDLNLAATYCDRVLVLHRGRLVAQGRPHDVFVPDLIQEVYGVHSEVIVHPRTGRPVITFDPVEA